MSSPSLTWVVSGNKIIPATADNTLPASPNSGYPMAIVAGALCCRLEKPGSYVLGGSILIRQANRIIVGATFLLVAVVAVVAVGLAVL